MTQSAPEDVSGREEDAFRPGESVVERRIRMAMEGGQFSDLPGAGRPIEDLDESYDPLWWVKRLTKREGITGAALIQERNRGDASVGERRSDGGAAEPADVGHFPAMWSVERKYSEERS